LLKRGTNEQPLHSTREASATGNHLKPASPECLMRETLDVCTFFASMTGKKQWPARIPNKQDFCRIGRQARSLTERYR
jgi:hypothetical protein